MDDLTGCRLNDYQLLRQLGRGAMAAVYLAEQQSLARRVAVKVLAAELCRDRAYVDRFQHEARSAASLTHPGIVQIYEVGAAEIDGVRRHYIAQEYVAGGSLGRQIQRSGVLEPVRVLEVLWQVGSALAAAAEQGLVHRDIKPDNLMLDRLGAVKVADFGLARLLEANTPRMTQVGVAMGTPLYMSPEQIEGREVDSRSDLYSLGVTAYQLLTGDPPFTGDTPLSVAVQHLNSAPDPVAKRRPNTPAALAAVIDRLIRKSPSDRYDSPSALLQAVSEAARSGQSEGWVTASGGLGATLTGASSIGGWSPRTGDDVEALQRLAAAMHADSGKQAASRGRLRRIAAASLIGLLVGAVVGGATAPRAVLRSSAIRVERFETVQQQLFHAKMAETPDAWQAVLRYHPEADALYHRLAQRSLALCLLRRDDAAGAARVLESLPDDANSNGGHDLAVAAARVVAYDRLGQDDKARTAGATLSGASRQELDELARVVPELAAQSTEVLQRLQ
ncbi:Serine/threonine-protein kinase PknB [Botrimarina colliarenosi]|uniref:non-specific serine/threonine protein kinase n=1 Tax=Botrimarina colliarenosi TaxID=2528001 RepID=A0A5C6AHX5_9BACT|nr:serine/threonine-protein kinase [Botrimarina colliarenosi]TWT99087.1 Serine/threonine-protein kinase PknB [Botrimarina colliarenosi]